MFTIIAKITVHNIPTYLHTYPDNSSKHMRHNNPTSPYLSLNSIKSQVVANF